MKRVSEKSNNKEKKTLLKREISTQTAKTLGGEDTNRVKETPLGQVLQMS